MKKIFSFAVLALFATKINAQNFGVGTATPGSKLTVNGSFAATYKLITANSTLDATDFYVSYNTTSTGGIITLPAATVAAPANGNILGRVYSIKNTGVGSLSVAASGSELIDAGVGSPVATFNIPAGFVASFISKGTFGAVSTWEVASLTSTKLGYTDVFSVVATVPVDVTAATAGTGYYTANNLNLGLLKTITIPANSNALVSVSYSVPLGTNDMTAVPAAYMGIRFMRALNAGASVEAPSGSRKISLPAKLDNTYFSMGSVSGQYSEIVTTGASGATLTYEGKGYVEQISNAGATGYRFNMYSATDPNYNWGRASMIVTVITF